MQAYVSSMTARACLPPHVATDGDIELLYACVCVCVCLFVVCLLACLLAWLLVCLCVYLFVCLLACLLVCLLLCLKAQHIGKNLVQEISSGCPTYPLFGTIYPYLRVLVVPRTGLTFLVADRRRGCLKHVCLYNTSGHKS